MSLLSRIPWPSHPGASCDARERNSAMTAIGGCFLLALGVVIAAMMLVPSGGDPNADTAGTLGGGYGTGSGDGFGAGTGSGSALAGDGPGAGKQGDRRGASGTATDSAPRGQRSGTVAMANAKDGESLVTGDSKEVPKFSFKIPDANDTVDPPQTATAVGKKNGNDGEGRAGAGGGGGTTFMGVRTEAKDIIYLVDFSASMRDADGREEFLKRELGRSIDGLRDGCRFTVILFGLSPQEGAKLVKKADGSDVWTNAVPMPPTKEWVKATAANRQQAISWVQRRAPDPQSGSGTWDSMRMALEMKPEAIFLLTDGEFNDQDLRDLRAEIERGNAGGLTQINTVAFASEYDVQSLQAIANENHGTYRRVTLKP
jgi:hypothetical protein